MSFIHEQSPHADVASGDPAAIRRIPEAIARRYDVLALSADENSLAVAVPDPEDREPIEHVRFATGMRVQAVAAPREVIRQHIAAAYGPAVGDVEKRVEDPPVVRLWNDISAGAIREHASDIHLEPAPGGGIVRQRVDGVLRECAAIPSALFERLIARIKLLAGMDIADRRKPQDGRIDLLDGARAIDARVASMPTVCGEKVVVRLFDRDAQVPALSDLGMDSLTLQDYRDVLAGTHGCIVVCGPTGSGKTTTLYASLRDRDNGSRQLCTIEDPVEMLVAGAAQIQVNPRAGLTFVSALRGIVRQDPDIIMIGEVRDAETAHAAMAAGLAGHLVLSSVHAHDAIGAIDRLVELGVERRTIASSVTAVLAQRLVRLRAGGRIGVFELLALDDELRDAIVGRDSRGRVNELLQARGFRKISVAARELVEQGLVESNEVHRVFGERVQ